MTDSKHVIYYYQTFVGLGEVLKSGTPVSVLNVSSLHFGSNPDGSPYIHLNDNNLDWEGFDKLWYETQEAAQKGIKVVLMLGGAGGAYQTLFGNFDTYYGLLKDVIQNRSWITGIDLDIEEPASLDDVKMLIRRIDSDFGSHFIITMAPVATSLQKDAPDPFSGFSYKCLYESTEGKRINWFNGQFYSDWGGFTESSYNKVVANGYPPDKVVMGMLSKDFLGVDINQALGTVKSLSTTYSNFAGVYNWEYFNSPPGGEQDPIEWAKLMSLELHSSHDHHCCVIM